MKNQQKIFLTQIEAHKGILLKIVRIYQDTVEDQEDLQQEIIYHLWKSYPKFKGESKFSSWMYRVALNTAITYFKRENKRIDKEPINRSLDIVDEPSPKENTQLQKFYQAVQALNKIEKALILLFMEGLSHKEIAINLGLTEGNTRVKLSRTKKKLREIIKNKDDEF